MFFLINYGGYTYRCIQDMPFTQRQWHVRRLIKKYKDEKEQHDQQAAQAKAQTPRRRR